MDFAARYRVQGWGGGVAWYLLGYELEWTEERWTYCGEGDEDDPASYFYDEPEQVENRDRVRAVMVGDDSVHSFGVDELEPIGAGDYCPGCGQIGCGAYGLEEVA